MTVCENGLKMLKSKHFPAKYIHYFTPPTPPPPQKVEDSSTVTEPSTESSENKEGATSSVQEIKIEQLENLNSHISFNLTINSNDPAALDILHNELIHWFPDELLE